MPQLTLKRAPIGPSLDDFDALADGVVVGGIFLSPAAPGASLWMWTLAHGHHQDRNPTRGYKPTRKAAMAFAKHWRKE